jgi:hypothetical protein
MFEKASRLKLRFNYRGICSVEDLWDMSLVALDSIFKELNARNKAAKEESLLDTRDEKNERLDLEIKIVKHIVSVRLQEEKERENAFLKYERKQKTLGDNSR